MLQFLFLQPCVPLGLHPDPRSLLWWVPSPAPQGLDPLFTRYFTSVMSSSALSSATASSDPSARGHQHPFGIGLGDCFLGELGSLTIRGLAEPPAREERCPPQSFTEVIELGHMTQRSKVMLVGTRGI